MGRCKGCSLVLHPREKANLQTISDHIWKDSLPVFHYVLQETTFRKAWSQSTCFKIEGWTKRAIWVCFLSVSFLPHSSGSNREQNGRAETSPGTAWLNDDYSNATDPAQGTSTIPKYAGPPKHSEEKRHEVQIAGWQQTGRRNKLMNLSHPGPHKRASPPWGGWRWYLRMNPDHCMFQDPSFFLCSILFLNINIYLTEGGREASMCGCLLCAC